MVIRKQRSIKDNKKFKIILHGTGLRYFSGSIAASLRLSSFRPTPGAPIKTNGRNTPGRGYNLHTSSYVAIISLSKSSFSSRSYIIFLVLMPWHMLFGFGELGGVEQIDAHEPSKFDCDIRI